MSGLPEGEPFPSDWPDPSLTALPPAILGSGQRAVHPVTVSSLLTGGFRTESLLGDEIKCCAEVSWWGGVSLFISHPEAVEAQESSRK